jgi:hypothetical protein
MVARTVIKDLYEIFPLTCVSSLEDGYIRPKHVRQQDVLPIYLNLLHLMEFYILCIHEV